MILEADPERRALVLVGGAQVLGGSFGPLLASFLVSSADVRGAFLFGAGCLVVSVVIAFALHYSRPRTAGMG
ncbi:MAG: hypothetical protein R3C52_08445 [Hyphomonadaceae bacterium]